MRQVRRERTSCHGGVHERKFIRPMPLHLRPHQEAWVSSLYTMRVLGVPLPFYTLTGDSSDY